MHLACMFAEKRVLDITKMKHKTMPPNECNIHHSQIINKKLHSKFIMIESRKMKITANRIIIQNESQARELNVATNSQYSREMENTFHGRTP